MGTLATYVSIVAGGIGSGRHPGYGSHKSNTFNKVRSLAYKHGFKHQQSRTDQGGLTDQPVKEHTFTHPTHGAMIRYREDHSWNLFTNRSRLHDAGHGLGDLDRSLQRNYPVGLKKIVELHGGGPGSGRRKEAIQLHEKFKNNIARLTHSWKYNTDKRNEAFASNQQSKLKEILNAVKDFASDTRYYENAKASLDKAEKGIASWKWEDVFKNQEEALMDLHSAILYDKKGSLVAESILAGGAGSGCKGPNCGRPRKAGGGYSLTKKQIIERENRRDWLQPPRPNLEPKMGDSAEHDKRITVGSMVTTTKPMRAFNNQTLEWGVLKTGTVATVTKIHPQIGDNPQTLELKFMDRDGGDIVNAYANAVQFKHDPMAAKEQDLSILPISKRLTKQQYELPGGARYTIYKQETAGRPIGARNQWKSGQPNPSEHSLKGKFNVARGGQGKQISEVLTYNLREFSPGSSRATVYDASKPDGSGTTVISWRGKGSGKVMELNRDANGYVKTSDSRKFNNLGHQATYLAKRYGIKQKLPKG